MRTAIEAFLREGKARRCIECGAESVLYFGFTTPCRYGNGIGGHHQFEQFDTTKEREASKLRAAYQYVPWFDRKRFQEYAPPEVKALLAESRA